MYPPFAKLTIRLDKQTNHTNEWTEKWERKKVLYKAVLSSFRIRTSRVKDKQGHWKAWLLWIEECWCKYLWLQKKNAKKKIIIITQNHTRDLIPRKVSLWPAFYDLLHIITVRGWGIGSRKPLYSDPWRANSTWSVTLSIILPVSTAATNKAFFGVLYIRLL